MPCSESERLCPTPRSPQAQPCTKHGQPAVGVESPGRRRKPLRHMDVTLWRPRRPAELKPYINGGDRWGPPVGAGRPCGNGLPARRAGAKARIRAPQAHRQCSWLHRQWRRSGTSADQGHPPQQHGLLTRLSNAAITQQPTTASGLVVGRGDRKSPRASPAQGSAVERPTSSTGTGHRSG